MRNNKGQFVKGVRPNKDTEFKKGSKPWNYGIKEEGVGINREGDPCKFCGVEINFDNTDVYWGECKLCRRKRSKEWYNNHLESERIRASIKNKKHGKKYKKTFRNKLKTLVLSAYSNDGIPRCNCCGEEDIRFLTIDHINNDGAEHRKEIGSSVLYQWLRDNNFPRDNFQVLCFNCNYGKRVNNGICPHKS